MSDSFHQEYWQLPNSSTHPVWGWPLTSHRLHTDKKSVQAGSILVETATSYPLILLSKNRGDSEGEDQDHSYKTSTVILHVHLQ
jgi:hypothetical protein